MKLINILFWLAIIWIILMLILFLDVSRTQASWVPLKIGGSQRQQDIIAFAWKISEDSNWIATLEAENGTWEENRIGITNDRGLCQLSPNYHWKFINSPEFKSAQHQLLYCASIYANAQRKGILSTTFYGHNNREKAKKNFIWFNN